MSETYKIRLKKGDYELEISGDKEFVVSKFDELSTAYKSLPSENNTVTNGSPTKPNEITREVSPVEFLKMKQPKSHTDRVVVFTYYLFHYRSMSVVNVDDIDALYSETRLTKSSNINSTMNDAVSKGHLTPLQEEKNDKKAWVITQTGDTYVETELKP